MTNKELQEELKKYPDECNVWAELRTGTLYNIKYITGRSIQRVTEIDLGRGKELVLQDWIK